MTYNDAWSAMNALNEHSFRLLDLKETVKQLEEEILGKGNGDVSLQYSYTQVIQNMIDKYIQKYDILFDRAWKVTISSNCGQHDGNNYRFDDIKADATGS